MKAIVADAYGAGILVDKDGAEHELSDDGWVEADVRDEIVTADGQTAWVRYREDERMVEVPPNTRYGIEGPRNDDVIDVRSHWDDRARWLVEAMAGLGTDEDLIYGVLSEVSGSPEAVEALSNAFFNQTGRTLRDALEDEMSGDELARALSYLE
jgi:Annexin